MFDNVIKCMQENYGYVHYIILISSNYILSLKPPEHGLGINMGKNLNYP